MRKITKEMVEAFYSFKPKSKSNTQVRVIRGKAIMYLFDNKIADLYKSSKGDILTIYDSGWYTVTTADRINGLLRVGELDYYQYQKNWEWFWGNWKDKEWKLPFKTMSFNLTTKRIVPRYHPT